MTAQQHQLERSQRKDKVWIIGSSYIRRGEEAALKFFGDNLGLDANVHWFGKGGMRWEGVLPCFYGQLSTQGPPDILLVHAGGNNLGINSANSLAYTIKEDFTKLHIKFPAMKIIFSSINERRSWRYGKLSQIIRDRKTINHFVKRTSVCFKGDVVEHPLLRFYKRSLFISDGVHFSDEGNHLFLSSIRSTLQNFLKESKIPTRTISGATMPIRTFSATKSSTATVSGHKKNITPISWP
ncbi:uncharacterized protein LOC114459067 [Gouania willdenowi]|uniref:uncharacterized protein LOC114459067 n=1 Tax=Gouania willdenowi TaxID=441366 RepID=UPI0010552D28|nr:uncharacterized protein LOC114459067 [Gouania willdenowi]